MVEYYLFYGSDAAAEEKDDCGALLVKVDGGFYYYDEDLGKWTTDNLYDDYCSAFTERWRSKSSRVVEISYDEAVERINGRLSKDDECHAKRIKDLRTCCAYGPRVDRILEMMTYAYAGLKCLWGEVDDEEGFITGAITSRLSEMRLFFSVSGCEFPEEKLNGVETSKKLPTVPYEISDEILSNKTIWCDGRLIYRAELILEGLASWKMIISRHIVKKSNFDGALRCYPDSVVGCWNVVFE